MKKVLVLHTSVGHGIRITAQNIYSQLLQSGKFEVRIADFHEVEPGPIVEILEKIYFFSTEKVSWIWAVLYSEAVASLTIPLRMFTASFRYKRILAEIRKFEPDIVISTETVPSGVIAYLKRKKLYSGKLIVAFSDYHLHRFWLYDECDLYLCNIAEQAEKLKALGIPENKIAVTGMIIAPKYLHKIPRQQARKEAGLQSELSAVLVSGGRRGLIASFEIVSELQKSGTPFAIAVVTGKNRDLKTRLSALPHSPNHPLQIFEYVTNQDVLMSAVDLLISKPGGPTIAEAVGKNLPIILTDAHPGHEQANLNYLVEHGIVQYGRTHMEVGQLAEKILAGEIKYDHAYAVEKLLKPKGAVSLTAALLRLNMNS